MSRKKNLKAQQSLHGGDSGHELGSMFTPIFQKMKKEHYGPKHAAATRAEAERLAFEKSQPAAQKQAAEHAEQIAAMKTGVVQAFQNMAKLPALFRPVVRAATLPFKVAADVAQTGGRAAAWTARMMSKPFTVPAEAAVSALYRHVAIPVARDVSPTMSVPIIEAIEKARVRRAVRRQAKEEARAARMPLFSRTRKGMKEFALWAQEVAEKEAARPSTRSPESSSRPAHQEPVRRIPGIPEPPSNI